MSSLLDYRRSAFFYSAMAVDIGPHVYHVSTYHRLPVCVEAGVLGFRRVRYAPSMRQVS